MLWSAHDLVYNQSIIGNLASNAYTFIPYTIMVYFNLNVLVPKLLLKRKVVVYVIAIGVCIAVMTYLSSWNLSLYFTNIRVHHDTALFFLSDKGKIATLTEILVLLSFSMTLYLIDEWHKKERYAVEIEQEKLQSELHQLKSQINPHFLFNSLNSIYVMLDKDTERGKQILLKFSDVLSHQLYESGKDLIPLSKEIENIKNYVRIEKIRHEDLVNVSTTFPKGTEKFYISPLLFLPIVENAFKHGQSNDGYWIDIEMNILDNKQLSFTVENSIDVSFLNREAKSKNGIGLANVKKRLSLLYPNEKRIHVEKKKSEFKVTLKIDLYEKD